MLIITRLVIKPFGIRPLHLNVIHTTEPSCTPAIGCACAESTQAKGPQPFQAWMSFQTHPPNSVDDSRLTEPGTHQLMVCPPQKNTIQVAHTIPGPVYCPRWSPHPSRTSIPLWACPPTTVAKPTQLPPWSCTCNFMNEAAGLIALPTHLLYTSKIMKIIRGFSPYQSKQKMKVTKVW